MTRCSAGSRSGRRRSRRPERAGWTVPGPCRSRWRRRPNWASTSAATSRAGSRRDGPTRPIFSCVWRGSIATCSPTARPRRSVFTLKELVRLVETLPAPAADAGPDDLPERIAAANAARRAGAVPPSRRRGRRRPARSAARRVPSDRVGARDVDRSSRGRPLRHGRGRRCGGEGVRCGSRSRRRSRRLPAQGGPQGVPRDEGHEVDRRRHGLHRAGRLPGVLRGRGARGRRRASRPRHRARRVRAGRADRRQQGRRASGHRSATTCIPRACRASTTTPTCWGWARAYRRSATRGRSSGCGWRPRSRAGAHERRTRTDREDRARGALMRTTWRAGTR